MGKNHSVRIEGHFRTWEEFWTVLFGDGKWRPFTINGFEFESCDDLSVHSGCRIIPYKGFDYKKDDRLKGDESYNSYYMSAISRTSWLGYFGVHVFPEAGYCEFSYRKSPARKDREPVPENYQDVIASLTVTIWSLISKDVTLGRAGDTND